MVRAHVLALSVTCASAFRTAQEAGALDVEEVQVHSHSHGMASLVQAHRAALFKRLAQPSGMSCQMIIPQMIQQSPDICTTLQMMDEENLSSMFGEGVTCTRADVEASCGGAGPMTCAEGLEAMISLITSQPTEPGQPEMNVAMIRAGMCTPPEDDAQATLPRGCADFAAVETACNGCSIMSYSVDFAACSQPVTDASGSGSTPGEPSGAPTAEPGSGSADWEPSSDDWEPAGPQNCSTYLASELSTITSQNCEMAVIMRPPTIRMMGGPECTPAEIQEACGAGPASCAPALNAAMIIQRQMMAAFGQEPQSYDQMRGEMCSTAPPTVNDLPPQCEDFAAVQALCGGCTNTTLDACAEVFAEPTTTTATTTTSNAKLISLCPLVAVLALLRLW